ncbi:RagB/SusD family nutrient uptake outer membrane protein [Prolixibacteraceae bacterium Z1-6]|uniref:RagB/SusD family nutrient uptake outer membrane protein n=1 Tax=Draconibacterium aestuarii TaxID=2998507 RepID=A0A9X3F7Y5_9BACT|nr:RagB/SusD family nutrient uptake outer membrane protein [Prolixibacteraceae bacterium Z1-6]
MMKIKYKYILGVLVLALGLSACDNFLTEEPILQQTNEFTLSTYKGLNQATLGAYTPFFNTPWYGRNYVVSSDIRGGNAKLSPKSSGRFRTDYQWGFSPDIAPGVWTTAYDAIARANNVINTIDGEFSEVGVTEQDLDNLKAECLFIRAMGHFDLVRLYGQPYSYDKASLGVPVVLVTEIGLPERNTVEEVYAQVMADLKEAENIIGDDYVRANGNDEKGFISKEAIQALLARVYLYMEDWQNAADYATKLIDNEKFQLYTAAEYTTYDNGGVFGLEAAKIPGEVIFQIYGSEGNSGHGNWDVIAYILSPDGYGDVGASQDLLDLFEDGDVRGNLFRTHPDFGDALWSLKYPGKSGNLRVENIPVLRLSEMYLIRAEAVLKGAVISGVSSVRDYNMIRTNRGLSEVASVSVQDIYDERRRELCFEGHELFDLARTKRGLVRNDYSGTVNQNVPFPDYKWAAPIPLGETDANPNIIQNSDY